MSCLFSSLQVSLSPETSSSIREKVCDYLSLNRPILDGIDTSTILKFEKPNYIPNMRKEETWGGAIEISAVCNIFRMSVSVHNTRDNYDSILTFVPLDNIIRKRVHLSWNGSHYTTTSEKHIPKIF
jgi:hypothetical protein